jgi:predicted DNA-binding protein (UPF0278 family)
MHLLHLTVTFVVDEDVQVRAGDQSQGREDKTMKKVIGAAVLSACLTFIAGIAVAQRVRDFHDLEKCHDHVQEAIQEMENARAANHYDMASGQRSICARLNTNYTKRSRQPGGKNFQAGQYQYAAVRWPFH